MLFQQTDSTGKKFVGNISVCLFQNIRIRIFVFLICLVSITKELKITIIVIKRNKNVKGENFRT